MGEYVVVDDWAIIGGMVGIHQFVHIGAHCFIAFSARVTMDVPPYILAGGSPLGYKGLNIVGLKRRGFTDEQIKNIKNTYNLIYGPEYNISDAIKAVKDTVEMTEEVKTIICSLSKVSGSSEIVQLTKRQQHRLLIIKMGVPRYRRKVRCV
jgi:UDP-N-acetylglucosamine acyltransferase